MKARGSPCPGAFEWPRRSLCLLQWLSFVDYGSNTPSPPEVGQQQPTRNAGFSEQPKEEEQEVFVIGLRQHLIVPSLAAPLYFHLGFLALFGACGLQFPGFLIRMLHP